MQVESQLPERKLRFGLGMDLNWESPDGFVSVDGGQFRLADPIVKYLSMNREEYDYFFFSIQPRSFDLLNNPKRVDEYFSCYDPLLKQIGKDRFSIHHTFLNLGTHEKNYPREMIADFTNAFIERYKTPWINEDLGIWSLNKKSLPYPIPPILNDEGLRTCIENINFFTQRLKCPLFVEFPGFSDGANFFLGKLNAFEFFKKVIESTDAFCTLDTGHILSYQWLLRNQNDYFKDLDLFLPFEKCREIHLSGCSIVKDTFFDFHHGVIIDEQIEMLEFLLPRCPNIYGVTYEDPKFTVDGELIPKSRLNFLKMQQMVRNWEKEIALG
ncbi:MAG: DUF692 family multinuclear iron-containing protein [Pseudobdellovibrionaceae bacterium]